MEYSPLTTLEPKKSQYLPLSIFLFGVVILLVIFFQISSYLKEQTVADLNRKADTNTLQAQGIMTPELQSLQSSETVLNRLKGSTTISSDILQELYSLLPATVGIASLSADANGKISINAVTNDPKNVSQTIELLQRSPRFKDMFVPSLSASVTVDRNALITFPIVIDVSKAPKSTSPSGTNPANLSNSNNNSAPTVPNPTVNATSNLNRNA